MAVGGDLDDDEKDEPFEDRLVKLARMARLRPAIGETMAQGTEDTRP